MVSARLWMDSENMEWEPAANTSDLDNFQGYTKLFLSQFRMTNMHSRQPRTFSILILTCLTSDTDIKYGTVRSNFSTCD